MFREKEFIKYCLCGCFGERMAASPKNSKVGKLTALPGVGTATAKKLMDAKLDSVSKVAAAGTTKLLKIGIQAALAKKIAAAAKQVDKASNTAKTATKSVTSAAKKAPSKAKSIAKKAPAKAKKAVNKTPLKAKEVAQKTAAKAKELAAKAKGKKTSTDKSKPAPKSTTKKVGPSRNTPVSKLSWFKNAKR